MLERQYDATIRSVSPLPPQTTSILADRARPGDRMCSFETDLQDRLLDGCMPAEVDARPVDEPISGEGQRAGGDGREGAAGRWPRNQVKGPEARPESDRSNPLPPAIAEPPRAGDPDRSLVPHCLFPSDSDEAALDAIAANGKPLTLPEAIETGVSLSTPAACPARNHRQARGLAADRVLRRSCPSSPAITTSVDFRLGAGGIPVQVGKASAGFNFIPGLGTVPVGLNLGTTFELAELKVQWLLLDFGRRLGLHEQARLASDIAGLQTERAYQTVADEVATAYYNVLRTEALRRTAQDALRRAEEQLADARKLQREGVVEREIVLRSEVQRAEARQQLHAATEAEFVALAGLNLAIGLKVRPAHPRRRSRRRSRRWPHRSPIACRRPSGNDVNSPSFAARSRSPWKGAASRGPTSRPRSSRTERC